MTSAVGTPTVEQLLAGAEQVGKLAEKEAAEAEKNASVSENVIRLIKETKISRILLPKKYNEPQVDLRTFDQIIRRVAYYDVSAAWLTFLYALHNVLPSFLPPAGRDEIVNQGGLICDIFAALGKGEREGNGFRISGQWDFVSGVLHSDWVGVGVFLQFPDRDKPEFCLPILRTSEVKIVRNWDTMGLRGTGSNRIIVDNVFVPDERVFRVELAVQTRRPPEEDYDKSYPFYHVPFFPAFYLGFASIALGAARRILDEFKKMTEKRYRLMDGIIESESPRSQRVLAEMTTQYHASDALMNKYLDLLVNYEKNGAVTPNSEFFAIRTKIMKNCIDIAVRSLLTLGGAAIYKGNPIEMMVRDILSVGTHKVALYEDAVAAYGKDLFGFNSGVRG